MKKVVVLGGGGHAKVVISTVQALAWEVEGFVDIDPNKTEVLGVPRLGGDEIIDNYEPGEIDLVNGFGSVDIPGLRVAKYLQYRERGFAFPVAVHPTAFVASDVKLASGCVVFAGAVIQPGTHIQENTIVNTGTTIDHDCRIGAHVHLAPGVTLSGDVAIGEKTHLGSGATVIQGTRIGKECMIGAGSVVVKNIPNGSRVVGVPARPL